MDLKRLVPVLLILGLGLGLLVYHALSTASTSDGAGDQPATQPAPPGPAATQPAATQPVSPGLAATTRAIPLAGATAPAAATQPAPPPATHPAPTGVEWSHNGLWKPEETPVAIGSRDPGTGYLLQVEFDTLGAGVRYARLSKYFETVKDKQLHAKDPAAYEEARRNDPNTYRGHYAVITPLPDEAAPLPLATRWLRISVPGASPNTPDLTRIRWRPVAGATVDDAAFEVTFDRDLTFADPNLPAKVVPYVRIVKRYHLDKNDYSIKLAIRVQNLLTRERLEALTAPDGRGPLLGADEVATLLEQGKDLRVQLDQYGPGGVPLEDFRRDARQAVVGRYRPDGGNVDAEMSPPAKRLQGAEPLKPVEVGRSDGAAPVAWVGCTNKYFASMMYLEPADPNGALNAESYEATFYFVATPATPKTGLYLTGFALPDRALAGGEELAVALDVFAGPKRRTLFSGGPRDLPYRDLYERLGYLGTIETSGCFCAFDWLTWGMMWLLDKLSLVAMGNYGVAIIMLVILVRVALHPLTKKGQVSMMKMQKLGPQMQKIKEKYKDDKEAQNREMMTMYKQAGATPILGCLPMFLQMPIWIALWTSLRISVDLRHAAFLPVWLNDLAVPDALIPFGGPVPIPGLSCLGVPPIYGFNLLPLLVCVAMVLQMKMNPQAAQAAGGQQSQQTSKMLMYMMPVMMLFIFYSMPAGLNLYIMTSTFAGVVEQKIIRRHIQARQEADAARETTVAAPGKAARGHRPKKPRGPFWTKRG